MVETLGLAAGVRLTTYMCNERRVVGVVPDSVWLELSRQAPNAPKVAELRKLRRIEALSGLGRHAPPEDRILLNAWARAAAGFDEKTAQRALMLRHDARNRAIRLHHPRTVLAAVNIAFAASDLPAAAVDVTTTYPRCCFSVHGDRYLIAVLLTTAETAAAELEAETRTVAAVTLASVGLPTDVLVAVFRPPSGLMPATIEILMCFRSEEIAMGLRPTAIAGDVDASQILAAVSGIWPAESESEA